MRIELLAEALLEKRLRKRVLAPKDGSEPKKRDEPSIGEMLRELLPDRDGSPLSDDDSMLDNLQTEIEAIQSPSFQQLPEHQQQERLIELRQRRKDFTDPAIYNPAVSARDFSLMQMKNVSSRHAVTALLERFKSRQMVASRDARPQPIASNFAREFVLVKNKRDVGYTIGPTGPGDENGNENRDGEEDEEVFERVSLQSSFQPTPQLMALIEPTFSDSEVEDRKPDGRPDGRADERAEEGSEIEKQIESGVNEAKNRAVLFDRPQLKEAWNLRKAKLLQQPSVNEKEASSVAVIREEDGFPLLNAEHSVEDIDVKQEDERIETSSSSWDEGPSEDSMSLLEEYLEKEKSLEKEDVEKEDIEREDMEKEDKEDREDREATVAQLTAEIASMERAVNTMERRIAGVSSEVTEDVLELLRMFRLPYVVSLEEAEAQCVSLQQRGLVDAIITEDSDVLVFGGDHVYKNVFSPNGTSQLYTQASLGYTREQLVALAMVLGCDYCHGIKGIGPVKAAKLISKFTTLGELEQWIVGEGKIELESAEEERLFDRLRRLLCNERVVREDVAAAFVHPQAPWILMG